MCEGVSACPMTIPGFMVYLIMLWSETLFRSLINHPNVKKPWADYGQVNVTSAESISEGGVAAIFVQDEQLLVINYSGILPLVLACRASRWI